MQLCYIVAIRINLVPASDTDQLNLIIRRYRPILVFLKFIKSFKSVSCICWYYYFWQAVPYIYWTASR